MELVIRRHNGGPALVGSKKRVIVEIRGVKDDSDLRRLVVSCRLADERIALINDLRGNRDTSGCCHWSDRDSGIATVEFSICPVSAGNMIVIFGLLNDSNCDAVSTEIEVLGCARNPPRRFRRPDLPSGRRMH